ncbi:helix-turn-helix domain-containing protein [Rhodococcus sp. NPDC057135]|uniref:helix-turn-helix domain-containing protein n=1 Tax=Rhodococcus sp. NPDC057135 TaxID=3346028 RepID=UPI00362BD33E
MDTAPSDPFADSLDDWIELIGSTFVSLAIAPETKNSLRGRIRNHNVGHLSAAEVSSSAQTFTRSKRLISDAPADLFQVGLVTQGTGRLIQDGRTCQLSAGDFAVYETARTFQWRLDGEWKLLVFTWQRDAIDLDTRESEQITARTLPGDSGISGILSRTLTDVVQLGGDISACDGIRFADELAAMTVTVGRQDRENLITPDDLMRRILGYIEANLSDPQLDPSMVARHFFISTRTLHRLFAKEGTTVAHWIRRRRLDKCRHALLVDPHTNITAVIARYGYFDLAQFSRNFSAQYGVNPTQFRARYR